MATTQLDKYTELAIRACEQELRATGTQSDVARVAAEKAAEAVRNGRSAREADLLEALRAGAAVRSDTLRPLLRDVAMSSSCSGPECTVGCGVGCAASCAISGETLIAFGGAGGSVGGAGGSIAFS